MDNIQMLVGNDNRKLVIENEDQAWEALELAVTEGFPDDVQIEFKGWPVFQLDIKGKDWHSTVPTRVMSPLLDVQKDINRAYANIRYGDTNLRKLKDDERDELEVVVKVSEGSSIFEAELWKQLSPIAQAAVGRMSGTEIVITVLGLGLLFTAPLMFKAWLASRDKEKEREHQREMSEKENRRLEIFAGAMNKRPELAAAQEDVQITRNRFLKVAKPGDTLAVKDVAVSADEAALLAQPERENAQDVSLNGIFVLLGNRTDKSEGFRITVRRLSDELTIHADVPLELPYEQQQIIQNAEWQKKKVYLSINASMLRESLSQAVVISAAEVNEPT